MHALCLANAYGTGFSPRTLYCWRAQVVLWVHRCVLHNLLSWCVPPTRPCPAYAKLNRRPTLLCTAFCTASTSPQMPPSVRKEGRQASTSATDTAPTRHCAPPTRALGFSGSGSGRESKLPKPSPGAGQASSTARTASGILRMFAKSVRGKAYSNYRGNFIG